jgi:hypothetical protein
MDWIDIILDSSGGSCEDRTMKAWAVIALAIGVSVSLHAGPFNTNLIVNGNAEAGVGSVSGDDIEPVPGWTTTNNFTVSMYGAGSEIPTNCPGPADRGSNFFAGGPDTALSWAWQVIDVSAAATQVDAHQVLAALTGWLGGWESQDDNAVLTAQFTSGVTTNILGTVSIGPVLAADRADVTGFLFRGATALVPAGSRQVTVTLTVTREEGSYNDGYADDLSLVLMTNWPVLTIQGGANPIVSWQAAEVGWQLQSTTNLASTSQWTNVGPPYQTNGTQIQYIEPSPTGNRFYRLQLP